MALHIDSIALETEETFQLVLRRADGSPLSGTADNEFFVDTLNVTIIDRERRWQHDITDLRMLTLYQPMMHVCVMRASMLSISP